MDKSLLERIAALKAKASGDPKAIDSIVDAVSPDDEFIQKVVEKIMSKMDADSEFAKYRVDAQGTNKKQAAFARAVSLLKQAFDMPMPGAPDAGGLAPSPMDKAFGENQATENADAAMPELAPVEKLEDTAHKYGDPALDALVNVIEMLIKKDMGVKDHSTEEPAKDSAPAPFGGDPDEAVEEDDAAPAPFAVAEDKPEAPKKKSPPKAEKSDEGEEDKSEPKEDEAPEEEDDDDKEEDKKPPVEAARKRVKALISLPEAQRLAKAAELRNLAKVVEAGELPDFLKDEADSSDDKKVDESEKMEKEALKAVFRAAIAALEAGENDEEYTMPADPKKREEKQEELEKEATMDRKQLVLAHLAKLRLQKEATVDGKSMPTPKEVPSPEGTVEDNLSGDAKIQYSPATSDRPISTIETKKQKLPTDKAHEDEAVMYFGDTPEAKEEIQSEKDSAKGVNNKRELKDMGTAVFSSEPKSPTEHMESGSGSHQKTKDWETAKSESDKTPTGERLVGLASEKNVAVRAIKLARIAQSKGMITTEDHFDEMVERYASYDDAKFALACEVVEETPAISAKAATRKQAQETVFSDNEAVEDEGDVDEKVPETKKEAILKAAKERAEVLGIRRTGGLKVPIVGSDNSRPMMPNVSNPRFAALGDPELFPWDGPTSKFIEAEKRGLLDQKYGI